MNRRLGVTLVVATLVLVLTAAGAWKLSGSRTWQAFGTLVARVETADKVVALTFDDAPTEADMDAVVSALAARGVRGTFYVNGSDLPGYPERLAHLVAAGHELGNHTRDHRRLVGILPAVMDEQVPPVDELISAAGQSGPITFRPPYGKRLLVAPWWLAQHDRTTVMWDVAAERYDGSPEGTDDIVSRTLADVRPGSIILLHPWSGRTATQAALGPIVDDLTRQGYTFVTVSELLARRR